MAVAEQWTKCRSSEHEAPCACCDHTPVKSALRPLSYCSLLLFFLPPAPTLPAPTLITQRRTAACP